MNPSYLRKFNMKPFKTALAAIAVAAVSPFVFAQTAVVTTTGSGTITEWAPGERVILKETTGPVTYRVRKDVTYVTKSGKVLTDDQITTRVRVGAPISVQYVKEGPDMYVNRFVIDDDDLDD